MARENYNQIFHTVGKEIKLSQAFRSINQILKLEEVSFSEWLDILKLKSQNSKTIPLILEMFSNVIPSYTFSTKQEIMMKYQKEYQKEEFNWSLLIQFLKNKKYIN